jgi:hypothetical protein
MLRKDYIIIADALWRALVRECELHGPDSGSAGGVRLAASEIAYTLERSNPKFDKDHFLAVFRGENAMNSHPKRRAKS